MNKFVTIFFSLILLVITGPYSVGAEDNQILLPQKAEAPYRVGDLVCVNDAKGDAVCGKIVSAGADIARLEVDTGSQSDGVEEVVETPAAPVIEKKPEVKPKNRKSAVTKNKKVEPIEKSEPVKAMDLAPSPVQIEVFASAHEVPSACQRTLASIEIPSVVAAPLPPRDYPLHSVSMVSAFNNEIFTFGPAYELQWDPENSMGVTPLFSSVSAKHSSVAAYGGLARYFRAIGGTKGGLRVSPFLGLISVKSTMNVSRNEYSVTSWVMGGALGYRSKISELFFAEGELGLQHLTLLSGDVTKIDLTGVKPLAFLSLGISF